MASYYDQHLRNKEHDRFYHSAAWKQCRAEKLRQFPICERCGKVVADHVHHVIPLDSCTEDQRLDAANLMSVCIACHNIIESQIEKQLPQLSIGTLQPIENDTFYFDAAAADKPCRFIEKFARHYEGNQWAGKQFVLLPWQRSLVRTLLGWKHRSTNLRRFRELYLITAKGSGKSPLIAAIGLYMLLGDNEPAAHVVSLASTFEQAGITFDAAKKFIALDPVLSRHSGIVVKQHVIDGPRFSKWTTVSGKPSGRSGPRPSCIIADEAHEWEKWTGMSFDMLCANLFKRQQPLLLVATNAGADRQCYAWGLHERAAGVLNGTVDDPTLLPCIFEAPKELDWRSEEAARAANPSIPDIVSFDSLKPEQSKGEARYRRLYLSQWVTGSDKWLDVPGKWTPCVKPLDAEAIKSLPRYVGLDLSNGDDLCAQTDTYVSPEMFYVDARFWLPRVTAEKYEKKDLVPYSTWAEAHDIELLEEATISIPVQTRIAQSIIDSHAVHPIEAVCYDRAYSSGVIPLLESAGIKCIKVPQGYSLSSGCEELDRRLIERSITIAPNAVLKFNAENVTVLHNKHGQYWPVKPNQTGGKGSMGKRSQKIDGIAALVTGLTEARKHAFAKPAQDAGALLMEL